MNNRNHQKQLEQELADKGIDGRETMEYLLEKVTNRSNMPVLFIILMMGCIGGVATYMNRAEQANVNLFI